MTEIMRIDWAGLKINSERRRTLSFLPPATKIKNDKSRRAARCQGLHLVGEESRFAADPHRLFCFLLKSVNDSAILLQFCVVFGFAVRFQSVFLQHRFRFG